MPYVELLFLITLWTWAILSRLNLLAFKDPITVWWSAKSYKYAWLGKYLLPTCGIWPTIQATFLKTVLSTKSIRWIELEPSTERVMPETNGVRVFSSLKHQDMQEFLFPNWLAIMLKLPKNRWINLFYSFGYFMISSFLYHTLLYHHPKMLKWKSHMGWDSRHV